MNELKDEFSGLIPESFPRGSDTRVVILTGAGISVESGLATFRGHGGLWEGHRVEEVATPQAFSRDPECVWRFYNARRAALKTVEPNAAHHALVALERYLKDGNFTLVTQNVDDLHKRAGSISLLTMHGELLKIRCTECGNLQENPEDLDDLPRCSCGGLLRPHIVWFGEMPFFMETIAARMKELDIFIAIGTSGAVYPAAGLVEQAKRSSARTIWINPDEPPFASYWDEFYRGPAASVVPSLVTRWTGRSV